MPSIPFINMSQFMQVAFGQWPRHCTREAKYLKNLLFGENGARKTNLLIPNECSRVTPQIAFVCGRLDCRWNAERMYIDYVIHRIKGCNYKYLHQKCPLDLNLYRLWKIFPGLSQLFGKWTVCIKN